MLERLSALFQALSPLWGMSLTAAWAAGAVFLLRLLLKKRTSRRVICALWLVVFARLLVPVLLESPVSLVPARLSSPAAGMAANAPAQSGGNTVLPNFQLPTGSPNQGANPVQAPEGVSPVVTAPVVTAPAANLSPVSTESPGVANAAQGRDEDAGQGRDEGIAPYAAGLWLAGAVAMIGCGAVTYLQTRRRVRLAVKVSVRVWEDENVISPFILGIFRPKIYLPSGLEARARRFILCHEFAHLRRLDHIVKPLCWLALAIHWFNPAVWAAFLLMSRDMEAACDEAVLRSLGEGVKADYSYTLLSLATGGRIPAPCPLAFDEGDAKGRIKNVLNYRRPALWIVVVSVVAVAVAAVCLLTDPVAAEEADGPDVPPNPSQSEPVAGGGEDAGRAEGVAPYNGQLDPISIPIDSYAQNAPIPYFLDSDPELTLLYRQAYSLYSHIFGANTEAIDDWPGPVDLPRGEPVELNGQNYIPVTGLFAYWDDFKAAVLSVFTPDFWLTRNIWLDNEGLGRPIFINIDGRTYYIAAARGSYGYNSNFPETFHLMQNTETEISFVMTGHYSENFPLEGESFEERDIRLQTNWEEYIGFPMKLVKTENGWRFAEFHSAMTDNGVLPYCNQAVPNPNLDPDARPAAGACVHGLDNVFIDRLIDGRLVFRCEEDWFPYYPPYPCAYNSSHRWSGDCDGDGHIEHLVQNSAGVLMLCDVVDAEMNAASYVPNGEMKTAIFDPRDMIRDFNQNVMYEYFDDGDTLTLELSYQGQTIRKTFTGDDRAALLAARSTATPKADGASDNYGSVYFDLGNELRLYSTIRPTGATEPLLGTAVWTLRYDGASLSAAGPVRLIPAEG